jgi:Transposase zinc-binding domain
VRWRRIDLKRVIHECFGVAYNSCRNRHCPKCQGAAAREWLMAREADLLPVVRTGLPRQIP